MNYDNCSFSESTTEKVHVVIHLVSVKAEFSHCYINTLSNPIKSYDTSGVSISNSYFLDSFNHQSITIGSNVRNAKTKTLTFSFVNTKLCRLSNVIICTKIATRKNIAMFNILILISFITK